MNNGMHRHVNRPFASAARCAAWTAVVVLAAIGPLRGAPEDPPTNVRSHAAPEFRGLTRGDVKIYFGPIKRSKINRPFDDRTGEESYPMDQVVTLEEIAQHAITVLTNESKNIGLNPLCGANIAFGKGSVTIVVVGEDETYFVEFDSTGRVTRLIAIQGPHGKVKWTRTLSNSPPVRSSILQMLPREEKGSPPPIKPRGKPR